MLNPALLETYVFPEEAKIKKDKRRPEPLRQLDEYVLSPIASIAHDCDPREWARRIQEKLEWVKHQELDTIVSYFLEAHLPHIFDSLKIPIRRKSEDRKKSLSDLIACTAISNIHELEKSIPSPEFVPSQLYYIPIDKLPTFIPTLKIVKDGDVVWLVDETHNFRIPLTKGVAHKGGAARLILKLVYRVRGKMLKSELPIKDYDVVVQNSEDGVRFNELVGEKDRSGIEINTEGSIHFIMSCRDVNMNEVAMSLEDGLIFTQRAVEAVKTGIIRACGGDHGLYGKDSFIHCGLLFLKPRCLERLIKFVIEGKAKAFAIPEYNLQFFMGTSLLLAVSRTIGKDDCAERLEKMYYILGQIGQLDQFSYVFKHRFGVSQMSIPILLEYAHKMWPFMQMEKRGDDIGVARWLVKKYLRYLRRFFQISYNMHDADFSAIKIDGHLREVKFSLDGFVSSSGTIEKLKLWIPGYMRRCNARNIEDMEKAKQKQCN